MSYLGTTVCAEIQGVIEACVRLSGMPDLTLSFMVGLVLPSFVECNGLSCFNVHLLCLLLIKNPRILDDVSFHPCVRFKRWESERVLSFVPPDGNFTLMNYHVSSQK